MATKIQNNVLSCDTKWRICYAYLLLMSVILCTLITCTQCAVCNILHVLDFNVKMINMWASLCGYNSLHSSGKGFPQTFENLAAEMCSYSAQEL